MKTGSKDERQCSDASWSVLRVLLPGAAVCLASASFVLAKTARDALYLQRDGVRSVPAAFIFIALLGIPQARVILASMSTFGPRATRVVVQLAVATGLVLYSSLSRSRSGLSGGLFFIAVPLGFSVLLSLTWLLTSELLHGMAPPALATGFNRVAVAAMLGGTLGAAFAQRLGERFGPSSLLVVAATLLVGTALVTLLAHRTFPVGARPEPAMAGAPFPAMSHVWRSRHVRHLVVIAAAGAFAAVMIDFQFYAAAAAPERSGQDNAGYFARVYLLVNAAALALQLAFGARLQRQVGIAGALLILPLTLLGGSSAMVLGAGYAAGVGLRLTEGGLRASIHRSSWEQSFIGIAPLDRTIAKVLVDGLSARLGAAIAGLLLYGWLELEVPGADLASRGATWIGVAIAASTVVWLIATIRLREVIEPVREGEGLQPFSPAPLPECCPTTAALGGAAYVKSP